MLPKTRRVNRALFDEVFPKTKIFSTDFFTIRFLKMRESGKTRFSVIISKKVSLKAVKRNFIKRRLMSILEKEESNIQDSFVVLIFCKKTVLGASVEMLHKEIIKILGQIQILKKVI